MDGVAIGAEPEVEGRKGWNSSGYGLALLKVSVDVVPPGLVDG